MAERENGACDPGSARSAVQFYPVRAEFIINDLSCKHITLTLVYSVPGNNLKWRIGLFSGRYTRLQCLLTLYTVRAVENFPNMYDLIRFHHHVSGDNHAKTRAIRKHRDITRRAKFYERVSIFRAIIKIFVTDRNRLSKCAAEIDAKKRFEKVSSLSRFDSDIFERCTKALPLRCERF